MGVTIHYAFGIWDEGALHEILQEAEEKALALGMRIRCHVLNTLVIDPHKKCETLVFEFKPYKKVKEKGGLDAEIIERRLPILTHEKYYEEMFVCSDFCKTQFAGKAVHKHVAEIVRLVASRCSLVYICDEGNYYETQNEGEAKRNIEAGQALIDTFVTLLSNSGFKVKSGMMVGRR